MGYKQKKKKKQVNVNLNLIRYIDGLMRSAEMNDNKHIT